MNCEDFETHGMEMVHYIANYRRTLHTQRVVPTTEPGDIQKKLPTQAPITGESFEAIMADVENVIMPGVTHWHHPQFHAYFPTGNSFPSILGDMLSDAIGCVGFSWVASPACTELEVVVMDWIAKLIKLPSTFLHEGGKGGGVIQGSASECVLVTLLASRHATIASYKPHRFVDDAVVLSKLVAYSSKLAHSSVEKAGMIAMVKMRQLDVDENFSLRGHTLERAIEEDKRMGLIPFYVCATLGTTSCCSYDNIAELAEVCTNEGVWLHVDAAYSGSAMVCPEFQHLMAGIEEVDSFSLNPHKWMLVNHDCSLVWVRDRKVLTSALTVDPLYLRHEHEDKDWDFRHWGIPLSRRFRSLKLWFVLRTYGLEGLQAFIRRHIRLAKVFEALVRKDSHFEVIGKVTMGLVCFRLKGPNALTQRLLKDVNESGLLYMVPALVNENFIIRFVVCAEDVTENNIKFAWTVISDTAKKLMSMKSKMEKTKMYEKMENLDLSGTESEDEVFDELYNTEMIYDQQRNTLKRACKRRNFFHRMVSDPRGVNKKFLRQISFDGESKIHSVSDLENGDTKKKPLKNSKSVASPNL